MIAPSKNIAMDPMRFPLPEPESQVQEALQRAWARQDLKRYLMRWRGTQLPEVPNAFFEYSWRACDIGCGMGKYILSESATHPERAYLGIDKGAMRGGKMLDRLGQTERNNLFGLHANAIPVLAALDDACLDAITIFYPNPWWPNKHRKKRWSYHPLLPKLIALLKPGGSLLITSNEAFYLAEFAYAMAHHPEVPANRMTFAEPVAEDQVRSHFEVKFRDQGIPRGELHFLRC